MKLFFKFFVFVQVLSARDIIVITYDKQEKKAQSIERSLQKNLQIPRRLIRRRWQKRPCRKRKNPILQICLRNDGGFSFPDFNQEVLFRSFRVFYKEKKWIIPPWTDGF